MVDKVEKSEPVKAAIVSYHAGEFSLIILTDRLRAHKIPASVIASLMGHIGNAFVRYTQEQEDKRDTPL